MGIIARIGLGFFENGNETFLKILAIEQATGFIIIHRVTI